MEKLAGTLQRLTRAGGSSLGGEGTSGRLSPISGFGSNPGALGGWTYVPPNLPKGAPLVVVLHGCTQTAAGYDAGSGWSEIADAGGFAVLFPEQQRGNNPNLCFNWFVPDDIRRGCGEAESIRQMIAKTTAALSIDQNRIFITGLSAGGAMAAVMLATHPDLFAGGAIIAGLPYGCAANVPQALKCMRGQGRADHAQLADLLRGASGHRGPWPTISVWHGDSDATVDPSNAEATLAQWRSVHGLAARPDRVESADGYSRRIWCDRNGREVVEAYTVAGMGHGTPLKTSGADGCGTSGPFMLDVGVSSTCRTARFWNVLAPSIAIEAKPASETVRNPSKQRPPLPERRRSHPQGFTFPSDADQPGNGVGTVIASALRKAGLMP